MPPVHIKVGGSWKSVQNAHVKVGGVWKPISKGYVKVGGVWKQFGFQGIPHETLMDTITFRHSAGTYTGGDKRFAARHYNDLYAFFADQNYSTNDSIIYRSQDNGNTWAQHKLCNDALNEGGGVFGGSICVSDDEVPDITAATASVKLDPASSLTEHQSATNLSVFGSTIVGGWVEQLNQEIIAGSVDGSGNITWGSRVVAYAGWGGRPRVELLTSTRGVVQYSDGTNLFVREFSVSGNTITLEGSATQITSTASFDNGMSCQLPGNRALILTARNDGFGISLFGRIYEWTTSLQIGSEIQIFAATSGGRAMFGEASCQSDGGTLAVTAMTHYADTAQGGAPRVGIGTLDVGSSGTTFTVLHDGYTTLINGSTAPGNEPMGLCFHNGHLLAGFSKASSVRYSLYNVVTKVGTYYDTVQHAEPISFPTDPLAQESDTTYMVKAGDLPGNRAIIATMTCNQSPVIDEWKLGYAIYDPVSYKLPLHSETIVTLPADTQARDVGDLKLLTANKIVSFNGVRDYPGGAWTHVSHSTIDLTPSIKRLYQTADINGAAFYQSRYSDKPANNTWTLAATFGGTMRFLKDRFISNVGTYIGSSGWQSNRTGQGNWTSTNPAGQGFIPRDVAYNGTNFVFVGVKNTATKGPAVRYTTDPENGGTQVDTFGTLSTVTVDKGFRSVAWSDTLGLFVAVGGEITGGANSLLYTSPDGVTWTARSHPQSSNNWPLTCVEWTGEIFVAGGYNTGWSLAYLIKSTDGINWTSISVNTDQGDLERITSLVWVGDRMIIQGYRASTWGIYASAQG